MKSRSPSRWAIKFGGVVAVVFSAGPVGAQGIVDMVVPHTGANAETAAYHARVRDQITSMLGRWGESLKSRDSVGLAASYTPNARSIVGHSPEGVSPLGVVRQLFATSLAGSHVDVTVEDFDMSGDIAFVSAVLIAPASASDAAPVFVQSLFVLRFDDWKERWQIREQFIDWREQAK